MVRVRTGEGGKLETEEYAEKAGLNAFDPAYAVRMLADLVPAAYVARELVGRMLDRLVAREFDADKVGTLSALIIDRLRKHLGQWRDDKALRIFAQRLESGRIEFRIRGDGGGWIMPMEIFATAAENADLLTRSSGTALERSLFLPIFKHELNWDEQGLDRFVIATALDSWRELRGTSLENEAVALFRTAGWKVATTPAVGDVGIDLKVSGGPQTFWFQFKGHGKPLTVTEVRVIAGVCVASEAKPVLIVVNGLTKPAADEAAKLGVRVCDSSELAAMARGEKNFSPEASI